jgi:membrane protease YdiL (CAAX protease family)
MTTIAAPPRHGATEIAHQPRLVLPVLEAVGFVGIVGAAELLTTFSPPLGLALHALAFLAALLRGAASRSGRSSPMYVCMAVGPLIRLLSLSLPLGPFPLMHWYVIMSIPLFAAILLAARALGYGTAALGVRVRLRALPVDLLLLVLGPIVGFVQYELLQPRALVPELTIESVWLPAAVLVISTAVPEELAFRGLIQRGLWQSLGAGWAVLISAALYAVLHIGYREGMAVLLMFAIGLVFAIVRWRSGSILGVTLGHAGMNVSVFFVWPFLLPVGHLS